MKQIAKVKHNKANRHYFISIPRGWNLNTGDYVVVRKAEPEDLEGELSIEVGGKEK